MLGENFVTLVGRITRPNFKRVGQNNTPLFKGSVAIPTSTGGNQYIKIAAWGTIAEALIDTDSKSMIKIHGHIEESSYEGKCRYCQKPERKYWTEVIVDNFMLVSDEEG